MNRLICHVAMLLLAVLLCSRTFAQSPPKLSAVSPASVLRGSTVDITLTGDQLGGATQLLVLDSADLSGELKPSGEPTRLTTGDVAKHFDIKIVKVEAKKITARLSIAGNSTMGSHQLRVITPGGVSNPVNVIIAGQPDIAEAEPNNQREQAQVIKGRAVVSGVIHAVGEIDYYRMSAKKGERLIVDVWAQRIGSPLDTSMDLIDASTGRVVAGSEDEFGMDSFINHEVKSDGDFFVRLRDLRYRGAGNYRYRLFVGASPYVASVFPSAVQRGKSASLRLIGANVPSQPIGLNIAPDAPVGDRKLRASTPGGMTNPVSILVSELPVFAEIEPNDTVKAKATAEHTLAGPIIISGRLAKPGDVDVYRFSPGPHKRLLIEVAARQIGSPVDALVTLGNADGGVIQRANDATGGDTRVDYGGFDSKAVYTLTVADLLGRGGADHVYRVSIKPAPGPGVAVRFRPDRLRVHRGGRTKVWAEVRRLNGYKGDVTLALSGLPKGVTAKPITYKTGQSADQVFVLSATKDAAIGSALFAINAQAKVGDGVVTGDGSAEANGGVLVRHAFLTVLDSAPFTVAAVGPPTAEEKAAVAAEIKALEKTLNTATPKLAAAQAAWENKALGESRWSVLTLSEMKSVGGARFNPQPDGSVYLSAARKAKDTYTLLASTDASQVTALLLDALPHAKLPAGGPGRADNGNFVLTQFNVEVASKKDPTKFTKVVLHKPRQTFAQNGFSAAALLDGKDATGWAIHPKMNTKHSAIFELKQAINDPAGSIFRITMRNESVHANHSLGCFRISGIGSGKPEFNGPSLPGNVVAALGVAADKRSPKQQEVLAAYYRTIAPELKLTRDRIAQLKSSAASFPPSVAKNKTTTVLVDLNRDKGFTGDVSITVEGFSIDRDKAKNPNPLAINIETKPVVAKGEQKRVTLTLKAKGKPQVGTRPIVIKATGTVNGHVVTQYSEAFMLTVK